MLCWSVLYPDPDAVLTYLIGISVLCTNRRINAWLQPVQHLAFSVSVFAYYQETHLLRPNSSHSHMFDLNKHIGLSAIPNDPLTASSGTPQPASVKFLARFSIGAILIGAETWCNAFVITTDGAKSVSRMFVTGMISLI